MELVLKNNAIGLLGGSLATGTTTVTLATGHGTKFPVVVDGTQYAVATLADKYNSKVEVVHITEHLEDADTMVVLRARESTTANTWVAGDRLEMRPTAGVFESIIDECEAYRDEAEAIKDALEMEFVETWDFSVSYVDGEVSEIEYEKETTHYKHELSRTGGVVTSITYYKSLDGGSTWDTLGTQTLSYDDGVFTGATWAAA